MVNKEDNSEHGRTAAFATFFEASIVDDSLFKGGKELSNKSNNNDDSDRDGDDGDDNEIKNDVDGRGNDVDADNGDVDDDDDENEHDANDYGDGDVFTAGVYVNTAVDVTATKMVVATNNSDDASTSVDTAGVTSAHANDAVDASLSQVVSADVNVRCVDTTLTKVTSPGENVRYVDTTLTEVTPPGEDVRYVALKRRRAGRRAAFKPSPLYSQYRVDKQRNVQ
jgi:hypothetical protein